MAITVTASQLWDKVQDVAQRYPKNWTSDCLYVEDDGSPVCLVGHAIAQIVNDQDVLARFFKRSVKSDATLSGQEYRNIMQIDRLFRRNSKLIAFKNDNPAAVQALAVAQSMQDENETWGVAIDEAFACVEGLG